MGEGYLSNVLETCVSGIIPRLKEKNIVNGKHGVCDITLAELNLLVVSIAKVVLSRSGSDLKSMHQ